MDDRLSEVEGARLWLNVMYEGPWERLMNRAWSLRKDGTLGRDIPDDHWRNRLAGWFEARHFAWVNRHIRRGTQPWRVWRRAVQEADQ